MPRLPLSAHGGTPFERLIGHNPAILEAWLKLEDAFFSSPTFTAQLREQVRRALAFGNRCEYCMARAGPPDRDGVQGDESLALAMADLIGQDHRQVLPEHVAMLAAEFGPAAAAELLAFASFISACQMFGAMNGLMAEDLPGAPDDGTNAYLR